jgi:PKD domain
LLLTISAFTCFLPISAQVSAPEAIGIKITSPVKGQEVVTTTTATSTPISSTATSNNVNNNLIVSGTSTDDANTECKVSVIVNNVKPYQPAVATGPAGTNDYSSWNFLLNSSYASIKEGPNNKITSKLECSPNLTKWYSVNVTGIPSTITTLSSTSSSSSSPSSSDTIASLSKLEHKRNRTDPIIASGSASPTSISFNATMLNITSPATDQEVLSGSKIALFGTSMDDFYKDCKVYAKKNDLPYQKVTASGLAGSRDYSVWKFSYEDNDNDKYSRITPGNTNNITAMLSCSNIDQKAFAPESKIFINNKTTITAVADATTAYATLNIVGINQPPVAVANAEKKEVKEGEEVTLDGDKSSDPNGDALTYFWKQTGGFVNGMDIINPDDAVAQFKVPNDLIEDTTFSFELTVEDGYGKTSTDIINIDAIANTKPVANAGNDIQAIRGEEVILDGMNSHDSDPTGKIISYFWEANNDGDNEADGNGNRYLHDSNQPVARFAVPELEEDTTFEFTLTVIDDEGAEDNSKMKVKVKGNSKPIADAGSNKEAAIGEQVTLDGGGSHDPDPTGQIVSYTWEQTGASTSINLNGVNTPTPSFTVPELEEDTTFEFTLTVIDDEGAEDKDKTEVKVEAQPSQPQQLSPIRQQQSLSEEQQNKQAQYEGEDEGGEDEGGEDEGGEDEGGEDEGGEDEGGEDENNHATDIWLPPPSSHIIRIPDIIDIFS